MKSPQETRLNALIFCAAVSFFREKATEKIELGRENYGYVREITKKMY